MKPSIRTISLTMLALATLVWLGTATVTQAHYFLGHSSVDGCEIRWKDYTSYDNERVWAQTKWEALMEDGCVDLKPDTAATISDLKWEDWDGIENMWAGYYLWTPLGQDTIYLNDWWMKEFGECKREFVAMQELGHAHGLDHSFDNNNVMNYTTIDLCYLGPHDIQDYEELWGD